MAVSARVDDGGLHVHLSGWDSILGFARNVDVAVADIVSVTTLDWEGIRKHFGRRLGSAYLPRGRAGGWFLVTKGRQHLVWCWLHRGEPALLVRTTRFRPGQVAVVASSVVFAHGSDSPPEWFSQRAN